MDTMDRDFELAAASRIDRSPALHPYREVLLDFDSANREEHLEWVATAPERELIEWAMDSARDLIPDE